MSVPSFYISMNVTNNTNYNLTIVGNPSLILPMTTAPVTTAAYLALSCAQAGNKNPTSIPVSFATSFGKRTGNITFSTATGTSTVYSATLALDKLYVDTNKTFDLETIKTTMVLLNYDNTQDTSVTTSKLVTVDSNPITTTVPATGGTSYRKILNITFDTLQQSNWLVGLAIKNETNYDINVTGDSILQFAPTLLPSVDINGTITNTFGTNYKLFLDTQNPNINSLGQSGGPIGGTVNWTINNVPVNPGSYTQAESVNGSLSYSSTNGIGFQRGQMSQQIVQATLTYNNQSYIQSTNLNNSTPWSNLFSGFNNATLLFENSPNAPSKPWPAQMTVFNNTSASITITGETNIGSATYSNPVVMNWNSIADIIPGATISTLTTYTNLNIPATQTSLSRNAGQEIAFIVNYIDGDGIAQPVQVLVTYGSQVGVSATILAARDVYENVLKDVALEIEVYVVNSTYGSSPNYQDGISAVNGGPYKGASSIPGNGTYTNTSNLNNVGMKHMAANSNCFVKLTFSDYTDPTPPVTQNNVLSLPLRNTLNSKSNSKRNAKSNAVCSLSIKNASENIAFNYTS